MMRCRLAEFVGFQNAPLILQQRTAGLALPCSVFATREEPKQRVEKLGLAPPEVKKPLESKEFRGACPTFSTRC
jgi:hypothetical protein